MPTSATEGKDIALGWYERLKPATVVDIGAGDGTYARLMRTTHRARWTAVEAWEPYIDRYNLAELYDEVIVSDVRRLPWTSLRADLVIAGDVLEHMTQDDARAVLRRARQAAPHVLVSVPVLHLDQDAVNGNPYERHIEHWTAGQMSTELRQWGHVESWVGQILAYFLWSREA